MSCTDSTFLFRLANNNTYQITSKHHHSSPLTLPYSRLAREYPCFPSFKLQRTAPLPLQAIHLAPPKWARALSIAWVASRLPTDRRCRPESPIHRLRLVGDSERRAREPTLVLACTCEEVEDLLNSMHPEIQSSTTCTVVRSVGDAEDRRKFWLIAAITFWESTISYLLTSLMPDANFGLGRGNLVLAHELIKTTT